MFFLFFLDFNFASFNVQIVCFLSFEYRREWWGAWNHCQEEAQRFA